jgi:hypothetical protein
MGRMNGMCVIRRCICRWKNESEVDAERKDEKVKRIIEVCSDEAYEERGYRAFHSKIIEEI